ncbi:MAG TPA: FkbM family methyltransferase [Cytophagaceae bacterium]|nr:FkbM family methyltransferase [Cytophagaceae bacterium]
MINKIKSRIRKIVFSFIAPPSINSYSQAGEDAVINFLFSDKKIKKITYLDLGTNIPDHGNNTFLFYTKQHRGVCVEADTTLIPSIRRARPEDRILNIGVSSSGESSAEFYIFDCKAINTFDKQEAEARAAHGNYKIEQVVTIPLKTINQIIAEEFNSRYPDLLSIDVEGLDLSILKSLDFEKYPIPVVCAETCQYSENHIRPKDHSIEEFMKTKGYMVYADTYINTIFVNKDWFYLS